MKRLALGALLVVFLLLLGTTLRPDDGTPYSITPVDSVSSIFGTSHAKPLPRVPSVQDMVGTFALATVAVLVVLAAGGWISPIRRTDDEAPPVVGWSTARVRRGPPTLL